MVEVLYEKARSSGWCVPGYRKESFSTDVHCLNIAQQPFLSMLICSLFVPDRDCCVGLRMLVGPNDPSSIIIT